MQKKNAEDFIIKFYLIGTAGIMFPYTRHFFILLTPLTLLISFNLLILFHSSKIDVKTILVFFTITVTGYILEVAGVNTGIIFGNYSYGRTLGIKIFQTPVIIGINWIMLVYLSASVVNLLSVHTGLKILLAALLMLLYDIILEQIAPTLGMWHWEGSMIPARNYVSWFIIALIFHAFYRGMKINHSQIAPVLLICQLSFFLALIFFFKVIL